MHMKKLFTIAVTVALVSVLFVMPVSAHGHHHGSHRQSCDYGARIQTPDADMQNQTPDTDTQTEAPDTNVQIQASDTECPVCTIEDCAEQGRHFHDNEEYCGYNHSNGYCDNTCIQSTSVNHHRKWYHCHDISLFR